MSWHGRHYQIHFSWSLSSLRKVKILASGVTQKIAKTGSLCCVAARPRGSHAASGDWSVGPHEPYWRTNTSFSPPPSRLDIRLQYEGLPNGLRDSDQLYRSSTSSNSKGSRGWVRGNRLYNHHYSASDGAELFLSSPSDQSQGPQWTPPAIQEINVEDYGTPTRRGEHQMYILWSILSLVSYFVRIWLLIAILYCKTILSFSCFFRLRS